ncbi:MAG: toxin-antitoxin system HicB family antitoxin [Ilumatobacteraceae bacterium]
MTKQTTVRLPDDLAEQAEVVARVQNKSLNEFIIGALTIEIDRVRKDQKFLDALKYVIEHDREILDRLAQ